MSDDAARDDTTVGMRHFFLMRDHDASGISGIGRVAEGFVFEDGTAVLRWLIEPLSTAFYGSAEELKAIHGHSGATRLVAVWDVAPNGVAAP